MTESTASTDVDRAVARAARRSDARTDDRIVAVAIVRFGGDGIDATSLDDLARDLGVTKQAILYWFPSKDVLVDAVIDACATELQRRFGRALATAPDGFERVETIVRTGFRLAARHPAMLGVIREIGRMGPPRSTRLTQAVSPLLRAAARWLETEMDAGRLRRHDPMLLVLMAYSAVTGLAAENEVLRVLGEEPSLGSLVRRRDQLVALLRAALVADPPPLRTGSDPRSPGRFAPGRRGSDAAST